MESWTYYRGGCGSQAEVQQITFSRLPAELGKRLQFPTLPPVHTRTRTYPWGRYLPRFRQRQPQMETGHQINGRTSTVADSGITVTRNSWGLVQSPRQSIPRATRFKPFIRRPAPAFLSRSKCT